MDYFSPLCCVEAAGRVEVRKCWGQIPVPPSVCKCCLRQLSPQPVLSLSTPRDRSAALSWGFRKLSASDFTLEYSDTAAQPRLPKRFEHVWVHLSFRLTDQGNQTLLLLAHLDILADNAAIRSSYSSHFPPFHCNFILFLSSKCVIEIWDNRFITWTTLLIRPCESILFYHGESIQTAFKVLSIKEPCFQLAGWVTAIESTDQTANARTVNLVVLSP